MVKSSIAVIAGLATLLAVAFAFQAVDPAPQTERETEPEAETETVAPTEQDAPTTTSSQPPASPDQPPASIARPAVVTSATAMNSAPTDRVQTFAFWPGAQYRDDVPTVMDVIGHKLGEEITRPEDAVRYFEVLQEAFPDQIKVTEYARSWEGRPLVYAAIGSAENIAKLDALRDGMQALGDPRVTSDADAAALIDDLPTTVWIAYSVHGNEISGTDAGMLTAYHLLAAENDEAVDKILENTVVFIDPIQNPDGRARFVHNFETTRGLVPDGNRIAAERNEPWPGGRTNHYLFDMNRDWFSLTQPETRGRIDILREWLPLIFVDVHEMGTDQTYYFTPEAEPYNPHLTSTQRERLDLIGKNNAKWFDQNGFDYFTREVYDALFPGYGASWPAYYGALSMTYEQSSARGLMAERTNGTRYHFRDTVRQQFVATISTAEAAADNRETLLQDFWDYQKSAIEEGSTEDIKSYILRGEKDPDAAARLARLLVRQGATVKKASANFTACGQLYKAGAFAIPLDQPAKRFLRTLLDENVPIEEEFLAEQERLRTKDLPDSLYDVTAWSLPHMYNVEIDTCSAITGNGPAFDGFDGKKALGAIVGPREAVAYVVNWGDRRAIQFLSAALRKGLVVKSSDKAFTIGETDYRAGSLILTAADNPNDLRTHLTELAEQTGVAVSALDSTWVDEGPNFGSGNVVRMVAPKIAIAWDSPTNPYQAGNTRFVIERQLGFPVVPVRSYDLTDKALAQFDVLILPGQITWYGDGYKSLLGGSDGAIAKWVRDGGTLVAITGAMRWATDPDVNLLSTRLEKAATEEEKKEDEEENATVKGTNLASEEDAAKALQPANGTPDPSSGVMARATVDPDHWLGAGAQETVVTLLRGADIYTPVTLDNGVNVARFAGPDDLVASGYLWEETKAQYAYKPFVIAERHGQGTVIGFTQDPAFRAQMDGLNVLLANAVFRAPAHSGKMRGQR
ncbi:MAG: M14 metallopeptidase family protein [Pseudomonadota bacterium]